MLAQRPQYHKFTPKLTMPLALLPNSPSSARWQREHRAGSLLYSTDEYSVAVESPRQRDAVVVQSWSGSEGVGDEVDARCSGAGPGRRGYSEELLLPPSLLPWLLLARLLLALLPAYATAVCSCRKLAAESMAFGGEMASGGRRRARSGCDGSEGVSGMEEKVGDVPGVSRNCALGPGVRAAAAGLLGGVEAGGRGLQLK